MITLLRNLVVKDFWLKLFSFALAVLTWFTISSAIQQEGTPGTPLRLGAARQRTFSNLPVVVLSSAGDVHNFRVEPQEIEVTVEGDAQAMRKLQASDLHAVVDLTGIQAAHDLKKRIDVSPPAGVLLVKVDPEQVQVIYPPRN
jgi:hypothetical protein